MNHVTFRDIYAAIGNLSVEQLNQPVQVLDEKTGKVSPIAKIHFPKEDIFSENPSEPIFLVKN